MKQDIEADAARWACLREIAKAHAKTLKEDDWDVDLIEVSHDEVKIVGIPRRWGWKNHEGRSIDEAIDIARQESP